MSNTTLDDYDAQIRAIQAANQPLLDAFQTWLTHAGFSEKTVHAHVSHINFFTYYLVHEEPLKTLNQAHSSDVWMFFASWFPRQAMWASAGTVKSNLASFKKFFLWMGETHLVTPQTVAAVLDTLKNGRDTFLQRVAEEERFKPFW